MARRQLLKVITPDADKYAIRDGSLVWIKNPITGVISYVVDVRGKSFAFTLGGRESADHERPS